MWVHLKAWRRLSQQPLTLVLTNAQTPRMAMSPGNIVAVWCGVARSALRLISLLAPGPRSGAHYLRPTPHLHTCHGQSSAGPTHEKSKHRPCPCPPRSYRPERGPSSMASAHALFTWAEGAAGLSPPDPAPPPRSRLGSRACTSPGADGCWARHPEASLDAGQSDQVPVRRRGSHFA